MQIRLKNVRLYCYHGLDDGEEILGGEYEVNLTASFHPATASIKSLEETVDYSAVYELVRSRMKQPTPLLETIATGIASEIIAKFPIVEEVNISISKLHPPIPQFVGNVGVEFTLKRNG